MAIRRRLHMRFHLGAIPISTDFVPEGSWRSIRQPSPWLEKLLVLPIGVVAAVVVAELWLLVTPLRDIRPAMSLPAFLLSLASLVVVHELIHALVHPMAGFRSGVPPHVLARPRTARLVRMSSAYTCLGFYVDKGHADQVRELLVRAGLNATVRAAGDDPPGCHTAPGQFSLVLWVQGVDRKVAKETFRRVTAEAFPPTYCEVCGSNVATHTVYTVSGRKRTERHLCAECYREGPGP